MANGNGSKRQATTRIAMFLLLAVSGQITAVALIGPDVDIAKQAIMALAVVGAAIAAAAGVHVTGDTLRASGQPAAGFNHTHPPQEEPC